MHRRLRTAFAAASLLFPAAVARGSTSGGGGPECDGRPGWDLALPVMSAVGSTVTVDMRVTAPFASGRFFASMEQGAIKTPSGWLCLELPFVVDLPFFFDAAGEHAFDGELPDDPALIGLVVYAQFLTFKPDAGVSNLSQLEIIADLAPGDFVTYEQDLMGVNCEPDWDSPACILEEWFDRLFPNGVILGDQDGPDGDSEWSVVFTSPKAIAKFLPDSGPIAELTGDLVDPTSTPAGELVAQLLVAKINRALDDAGAYDELKLRDALRLADLIYVANVNPDIFGFAAGPFIDVCDLALSGALGTGDLDINGDGDLDAYLTDLSDALGELNKNFDSGGVNLGSMKYR